MKCVAGCKVFTGGEIRHHKDCPYYPESLSKIYDELLEKSNRLEKLVIQKIAEVIENMKKKIETSLEEFYQASPESRTRAEYHELIKEAELQVCDELLKEFESNFSA